MATPPTRSPRTATIAIAIEIAVRCRAVSAARSGLRRVLARILEDHDQTGTLSLAIVGDREIRRVHRDFLGEDSPTDVISFPLGADTLDPNAASTIGEVVVSAETARREARRRGLPPGDELALYAIHGTLHLVGYDDLVPARKRLMRRRERKYLSLFTAGTALKRLRRRSPRHPRRAAAPRRKGT